MAKRKTSPAKSRKTSTKSLTSKRGGTTPKKKQQASESAKSLKKKKHTSATVDTKSAKKSPPTKSKSRDQKSDDLSLSKKKKSTAKTISKKPTKVTPPKKPTKIAATTTKAKSTKAPEPRKVARKKSTGKTGPQKVARKKSAATSKPRKVSRGKSAAEKSRAKVGPVAPKRKVATKAPSKVEVPSKAKAKAKLPSKAQQLQDKLRATVAKQRAEQEAAAKWRRPKPPVVTPAKVVVKPKPRNRVYVLTAESSEGFREGKEPEKARVRVSSHGNKKVRDFHKVFAGAFKGALKSTPFEDADEAPVSRYGIAFRVPEINNMQVAKGAMREWLNLNLPEHASAHLVESETSIVVHLNFGKYDDYSVASEVVSDLRKQQKFIISAMDKTRDFTDYADDYIWFAEWDWDDDITDY
jgi:hypothetical protein